MARANEITSAASDLVYDAMRRAGLSVSKLAEKSGIPRPTVSVVVNGKRTFRVDTFFILVEACGREVASRRRA